MYVPLGVEPQFWFGPRTKLDSRLNPSPSILALKIVQQTTKKHLRFIAQHERKLLQRIDPEDASHIYTQFGLDPPDPTKDPNFVESSEEDAEPYRLGDLEPITVVGLRSHHHPDAQVRAQALSTWKIVRDEYHKNQRQVAKSDSWSWVVQDDNAISEAAVWSIPKEGPDAEDPTESSSLASACTKEYSDDDGDDDSYDNDVQWSSHGSNWSDDEDQTDPLSEEHLNTFSEQTGQDQWPTELPTPPPSNAASCLPSPMLSESHIAPINRVSNYVSSSNSSVTDESDLKVRDNLSQVLGDRKIMETFLERIAKRIKESYMTKSKKEAEKAYNREKYPDTNRKGQKARGEGRADPRRALRFRCGPTISREQAEQHLPEATYKAHFEANFQMIHQYEDATGRVYTEPVTTEGLPPDNKFEWTRVPRKKRFIF